MDSKQPLFRSEAMDNRLHRSLGTIRLSIPFNYQLMSCCVGLLLFGMLMFLVFAKTTEQIRVQGFLDTEQGLVTVPAPSNGRIVSSTIVEGDVVKKGAVLFLIASENKNYIRNLTQRISNLKKEQRFAQEHYHSLQILLSKGFTSANSLKEAEIKGLELANQIKVLELDRTEYLQRHQVTAPIDGIVTNILYKPGQSIDNGKPLVHIIPQTSKLIAQIYIPTHHIGFLQKNSSILIHYDAYPAQRFGTYKAIVKEINLMVLTDDQENKPIKIGRPYYKIKAELIQPYVLVYGKQTPLSHGLTLSAVINGETKKIWQWILDPLYSYYG